jgi:hypothetical protein
MHGCGSDECYSDEALVDGAQQFMSVSASPSKSPPQNFPLPSVTSSSSSLLPIASSSAEVSSNTNVMTLEEIGAGDIDETWQTKTMARPLEVK